MDIDMDFYHCLDLEGMGWPKPPPGPWGGRPKSSKAIFVLFCFCFVFVFVFLFLAIWGWPDHPLDHGIGLATPMAKGSGHPPRPNGHPLSLFFLFSFFPFF